MAYSQITHALSHTALHPQVQTAMLAHMFGAFSFQKLLQATRNSTTEVATQQDPGFLEDSALAGIWEGPVAAKMAQVWHEESHSNVQVHL